LLVSVRSLYLLCLLVSTAHADHFIVVRSDAPLYEQPLPDAAKGYVSRPRSRPLSHLVFHVVGEGLDFVEVESNPELGSHCYQAYSELRAVALHAFVRRGDLAPVTTRETTVGLANGTSVMLASGLAVMPATAGMRRVSADDWSLLLEIPPTAVGLMYEPHASATVGSADEVTTPGPFQIAGQPLFDLSYPLPAYDVTRRNTDVLATVLVRCARFRLSLPRSRITTPDGGVLGGLVSPVSGFTVRAGAPVYWRDGTHAGSMRRSLTFAPSRAASGRQCAQIGDMPICFDVHDISLPPSRAR